LAICQLFDQVSGCQFWIKDLQGYYLWVNSGFLQNFHLNRREEAIGRREGDFSEQSLADQHAIDDALVYAGNSIVNRVEKLGFNDHAAIWTLTTKLPLVSASGKVEGLAGLAFPVNPQAASLNPSSFALGNLIAYIRAHYSESITNKQLARLAHMSVRTLERCFSSAFMVTPQQYIKQMRVRMASHALAHTDQSIASIANSHGFSDQGNFVRNFRQFMGETPSQFRKKHRNGPL